MKNSIDIDSLRKISLEESDRISSSSHHVDWDLGNGDFTTEAWIPPEAIDNEAAIVKSFNGYIEELRITKGAARYRTSIDPLPIDRAQSERPIGWLWRVRAWFRGLLCQHHRSRLVAIDYDGTTVHECVTCGKLIRRSP